MLFFLFEGDEIVPVFDERLLDPRGPSADIGPEAVERRRELLHRPFDHGGGGLAENGLARGVEASALRAHVLRGFVDFARQLVFRFGERALGRVVEDVELFGADRLSVEDRERLNAAVDRTNAEAQRFGDDFELPDDRPVLRFELRGEFRLRAFELFAFHDRRNLLFELLDERAHRLDDDRTRSGRKHERTRRFGMIEVVDVDDVVRGRMGAREARGVADDVVLDHHLGLRSDEDMEAGLACAETELERTAGDARHELEEPAAVAWHFGDVVRIGPDNDVLGGDAKGQTRGRRRGRRRRG